MTDRVDEAALEAEIIEILKSHRPGTRVPGCNGMLETYAKVIHDRIVAPRLAEAGRDGRARPIDDLGHDTHFARVWNRTIAGKPESWDCRAVTATMISAATKDCGGTIADLMNDNMDPFDDAIIRNLPGILSGSGMRPASGRSLTSWVDGGGIDVRLDGFQAHLEREGAPLEPPMELPAYLDMREVAEPTTFFALMSWHAPQVDRAMSDRAWGAWHKAMDEHDLMRRGAWDSCAGMIVRSIKTLNATGILWQHLRQDESVSVNATEDGVTVYRGMVDGLERVHDEGQLLSGYRSSFVALLTAGGFTEDEAETYLERLAQTSSACSADIPAGAARRVTVDPEVLYAFEMPDFDMCDHLDIEEARPIIAWGTFPMPDMPSYRALRAAAQAETDPEVTP